MIQQDPDDPVVKSIIPVLTKSVGNESENHIARLLLFLTYEFL